MFVSGLFAENFIVFHQFGESAQPNRKLIAINGRLRDETSRLRSDFRFGLNQLGFLTGI
jgi:hypothetical protein